MSTPTNKCVYCKNYSASDKTCVVSSITNEITGEVSQVLAVDSRNNEDQCGVWGQLFDPS